MKDHIAVIGAGAWGTALAIQADRAGQSVMLWARDAARAALMAQSRANERLLPGVPLPPGITVTANATQALQDAALILLVVPAQALRPVLQSLPSISAPVLICAKGVEAGSLMLPLEVLAETHPGTIAGVLSGPNFAHEIARGLPAAAVLASADASLRALGVARLGSPIGWTPVVRSHQHIHCGTHAQRLINETARQAPPSLAMRQPPLQPCPALPCVRRGAAENRVDAAALEQPCLQMIRLHQLVAFRERAFRIGNADAQPLQERLAGVADHAMPRLQACGRLWRNAFARKEGSHFGSHAPAR
ncbi:MAG: hypothetical protein EBU14_13435, partial [Acetobacteraceae bacterium]|nr:hypothetical protein [Acetobacteraceae bacterium]